MVQDRGTATAAASCVSLSYRENEITLCPVCPVAPLLRWFHSI
ncbi:hypothetical protein PhaeoP14_03450 [Phaeobacter piscinae]|nr:hypothetical protein PhaeoP14_03450 [Phaeobacter piscinae]